MHLMFIYLICLVVCVSSINENALSSSFDELETILKYEEDQEEYQPPKGNQVAYTPLSLS